MSDEQMKNNCSQQAFTNIDSALKCGADPNEYKSLLFAFANTDIEKYKKTGWDILKDEDIIILPRKTMY